MAKFFLFWELSTVVFDNFLDFATRVCGKVCIFTIVIVPYFTVQCFCNQGNIRLDMKTIVKDLTEGMQRLCAVANRVVTANGKVSALERDLLLEDLRHLYDVALRIETNGEIASTAEEQEAVTDHEMLSSTVMATMAAMSVPEPEPERIVELEPEPIIIPEPKLVVETEQAVEPVSESDAELKPIAEPEPKQMPAMEEIENTGNGLLFDEILIEPEPEHELNPEPILEPELEPIPEQVPEPNPEPVKVQASLLDYLKHPQEEQPVQRTLGESLGSQQSAVGSHKVDDLRTVININDKFSFMSELFKNNMRAYNDFIMMLNGIGNREEALAEVAETAKQYQWDENSVAVQTFYKIFDKKF